MNSDVSESHPTSFINSTLTSALLLSLVGQRYSPKTAHSFDDQYDFIVVGAGSAGSVVASRLSEKPCVSVLLLEAGKSPPPLTEVPALGAMFFNTDIDWAYKTAPQKHCCDGLINRQVHWPSGKVIGGTSVLNAMQYVRGNRKNYDDWAAAGAKGWSYDDVLPYFVKMEDNQEYADDPLHGTGGPVTVSLPRYTAEIKSPALKAAENLGYQVRDSNGVRQTGFYDEQATIRDGQRCSVAKAYLVPAENRTNLSILPNARVRKVIIKNKRAVGVVFDYKSKTHVVRTRREVILSAGTINTAQLLMLSGIGPKKQLERHKIPLVEELPVGQNLQDHGLSSVFFELSPTIQPIAAKIFNPVSVEQYVRHKSGPLASAAFVSALAFLQSNSKRPGQDFPDYQLFLQEGSAQSALGRVKPEVYAQFFAPYEGKAVFLCASAVLQPKSRGSVKLRSADPYDPPIIDPNYYKEPEDVEQVVRGLKACMGLGEDNHMTRAVGTVQFKTLMPGCEHLTNTTDEYWRCYAKSVVSSLYHQVGTAKMGDPRDKSTVVDPELRVKNIQNLRVVDASVMPIVPSGNTNVPTIMVAEKASDVIKSTIQCP